MQVNLDKHGEDGTWFVYEDEPNLELLIAPLTPLIDDECLEKATQQPAAVNGRFRRQIQMPRFRNGLYKRLVFQKRVLGWRAVDPTKPALVDATGAEIPYSEEAKAAISEVHSGLVDFGFDIATALGQISAEQVRDERAAFRRTDQIPSRLAESEL